jgi:hypothetical protein
MRAPRFSSVLSVIGLLVIGGCGAGAATETPQPTQQPHVDPLPNPFGMEVLSTAELDGVVRSDGTFDASGDPPVTGDLDGYINGLGARQFFSFDFSDLPAGARVVGANLQLMQSDRINNPYPTHGTVEFEHVDYGPSLDGADYDTPILARVGGLFAPNPNGNQSALGVTVTAQVLADIAASRTRSQYRLRFHNFDSNFDGVSQYTVWVDRERSDLGTVYHPHLTIWYYPAETP